MLNNIKWELDQWNILFETQTFNILENVAGKIYGAIPGFAESLNVGQSISIKYTEITTIIDYGKSCNSTRD